MSHTHTHGHCSQFTSPQDTNSWCHAENFTATWYQHSIVSVEDTASTSALCWFITNTFCHFRCTQRWFALRSLRARCYIKLSEYVRVNIAVRVSDACWNYLPHGIITVNLTSLMYTSFQSSCCKQSQTKLKLSISHIENEISHYRCWYRIVIQQTGYYAHRITSSVCLFTHAEESRESKAFICVCLCERLCVSVYLSTQ